ncbi:MAG: ABC transporter substrate-binding protein, partial [Candidatus Gracilibacteria bacterium]|nr:ABC transporter substrate-binding protein [Candidatus Gracilibacteria bacterium]
MVPIQGGTVSEGLIGNLPSLNPLKPLSGNNQYIVGLLYRSLLKFDLKENKIVGDLATCDINNMLNVECYLKDNIFWSNGEAITADDVIATYDILKTSGVNKILSSLLEETTIEKRDNVIVFKNTKKDINFLNVFLQPILPKETIDSLSEDIINGNFPTEGQIYSGEFQISNITSDLTLGITKIEFDVNKYLYNGNISKLIINMFPNTNSMLQNKETINIFNDDDNIIGDSIPRLENHKYTLPQYVSLFINENKVKNINLRNNVLEKINTQNLVKLLGEDKYKVVNNPYLTETVISEKITDKNFEKIMSDMGYVKKSKIIEKYLPIITNTTNTGTKVEEKKTEVVEKKVETPIKVDPKDMTIDKFQVDSKYITEPAYVDKYNFITKDDVLLQGNAGSDIEEVYVNDYKLVSFKKGNPKFYYRLKESMGTIKGGVNTYKIYFVVGGKKELKEELTFVFYRNKGVLETETQKFIQSLYEKEQKATEVVQEKPVQTTVQKPVETTKQNTEQTAEQKAKLEQINKLDEKFYYNDKLEQFTL